MTAAIKLNADQLAILARDADSKLAEHREAEAARLEAEEAERQSEARQEAARKRAAENAARDQAARQQVTEAARNLKIALSQAVIAATAAGRTDEQAKRLLSDIASYELRPLCGIGRRFGNFQLSPIRPPAVTPFQLKARGIDR